MVDIKVRKLDCYSVFSVVFYEGITFAHSQLDRSRSAGC